MNQKKQEIVGHVSAVRQENETAVRELLERCDRVCLTDYEGMVRTENGFEIWTEAFRAAVREHEIIVIPAREKPYAIDGTVILPSDRRIEAEGATLLLTPSCKVLMFRNEHTLDGTHAPIAPAVTDCNISFCGGTYAESSTQRAGYGATGKYDEERSFYGVSSCMFFDNMKGLTMENVIFRHCAGFAVQAGDIRNAVFSHIRFQSCFADGLHLNGNSEGIFASDVAGEVNDDLIAFNMYDWQNSSVNFGPIRWVLCENMELNASVSYKALRIEPGIYYYDDGSSVDCAIENAYFRDIRGIRNVKLYYQTPAYSIGTDPERGDVGSADNLFFEDMDMDLDGPIDHFDDYLKGDPVRGAFGAFEICANMGSVSFENIRLTLYREKYPLSRLVTVGPKSILVDKGRREVFDPYVSCHVGTVSFENITVNGQRAETADELIHISEFRDINGDGHSSGKGVVEQIFLDGIRTGTHSEAGGAR